MEPELHQPEDDLNERRRQVIKFIEADVERFSMSTWAWDGSKHQDFAEPEDLNERFMFGLDAHECGMTVCMGGAAVHLYPQMVTPYDTFQSAAQRILKMDGSLFYRDNWPQRYRNMADEFGEHIAAVQLLQDHIDQEVQ